MMCPKVSVDAYIRKVRKTDRGCIHSETYLTFSPELRRNNFKKALFGLPYGRLKLGSLEYRQH